MCKCPSYRHPDPRADKPEEGKCANCERPKRAHSNIREFADNLTVSLDVFDGDCPAYRPEPSLAGGREDDQSAVDYQAMYHELVYAVASKFPDETRHQTALRYIREAESGSSLGTEASCNVSKENIRLRTNRKDYRYYPGFCLCWHSKIDHSKGPCEYCQCARFRKPPENQIKSVTRDAYDRTIAEKLKDAEAELVSLRSRLAAAEKDNERYREALERYADEKNWTNAVGNPYSRRYFVGDLGTTPPEDPHGYDLAAAALGGEKDTATTLDDRSEKSGNVGE